MDNKHLFLVYFLFVCAFVFHSVILPIRCEMDIDECAQNSTPCLNNGSCQNNNGTFSCTCPAGFLGDTCEIPVSLYMYIVILSL